jgi:hypothetical protein
MPFSMRSTRGRTNLKACRLGISSSFGAPAAAYEAAFERGCNYFTRGTFMRGPLGSHAHRNPQPFIRWQA